MQIYWSHSGEFWINTGHYGREEFAAHLKNYRKIGSELKKICRHQYKVTNQSVSLQPSFFVKMGK